jgi:hypothetical protein
MWNVNGNNAAGIEKKFISQKIIGQLSYGGTIIKEHIWSIEKNRFLLPPNIAVFVWGPGP